MVSSSWRKCLTRIKQRECSHHLSARTQTGQGPGGYGLAEILGLLATGGFGDRGPSGCALWVVAGEDGGNHTISTATKEDPKHIGSPIIQMDEMTYSQWKKKVIKMYQGKNSFSNTHIAHYNADICIKLLLTIVLGCYINTCFKKFSGQTELGY